MKKKDLKKEPKKELIKIIHNQKSQLGYIRKNYRELKADVIVLKKQLENIVNNICISNIDRLQHKIRYYKGGNNHKKTINASSESRVRRKTMLKNCNNCGYGISYNPDVDLVICPNCRTKYKKVEK